MASYEFDLNGHDFPPPADRFAGLPEGTMEVKGHYGSMCPKPGDRQFVMVNGKVIADRVITSATMDQDADGFWEITADTRPATKADGPPNRRLIWTVRWAYIRRRVRRLFGLRSRDGEWGDDD